MRCHEDFGFDRPRFTPYYCAPMTDAGDSDRSASAVRGIQQSLPLYIDIRKAFRSGVGLRRFLQPRAFAALRGLSGQSDGEVKR